MEALTEYAYRARLRDITDMSVVIDASSTPNNTHLVKIHHDSLARVHRFTVCIANNTKFDSIYLQRSIAS